MSAPRFAISRDFSWLAFGCLVAVLIAFGLLLLLGRFFGPLLSMGDRGSGSELLVQNLSPASVVFAVEDSSGARFYLVPVNKAVVIDTEGKDDAPPDAVRIYALDCAAGYVVVRDASTMTDGGTITVDSRGFATFASGRIADSFSFDQTARDKAGSPTCEEAAAQ